MSIITSLIDVLYVLAEGKQSVVKARKEKKKAKKAKMVTSVIREGNLEKCLRFYFLVNFIDENALQQSYYRLVS